MSTPSRPAPTSIHPPAVAGSLPPKQSPGPDALSDSSELALGAQDLPEFATVMRGYDRGQVEDYVTRLQEFLHDAEVRATNADRRVSQTQRRMEDLERELGRAAQLAERPAAAYDGLGERIATILRLAAEEADSIRTAARQDADATLEETRREREQVKSASERDLAELSRRRDGVVNELNRVRDVLTALGLAGSSADASLTDDVQPADVAASIAASHSNDSESNDTVPQHVDGSDASVIELADRQAAV
jgi:cell division septum initiation protein DivIVA